VYLVALDAAGNHTGLAPQPLPLMISQNSDRPIVKLSNIRTDGGTVLKMVNTVFGSVNDDDGSIVKFELSENGTVWTEQLLSGGSFSYDASAGDGAKTIYFRVTDAKNTVFSTSAATSLEKPRIETNPAELPAAYVDGPVAFQVDTAPPEINSSIMTDRSVPFDFVDELTLATNMPFGGNSALFRLRAQASDSNGIASVSFSVPGAPGSPFAAILDGGHYRTPTIDISGVADGPLVITIEATDNSGLKTSVTRTVIIDNSAPSVSFTNPRSLIDVVNGNVEVKGLASDGGSGLKSVQYKVGYNHAAQSWQDVGGSLFSWQVDFKDANRIDIYANPTDGSDDNLDDIWQVPVLIRAEDNAGNVYISTVTDYILLVDPSGDKPKAFVIYPDPAALNRTLGGNIRIFGSAEDDDGIQAVYMQVDVNGDGLFDAADVASNGVNWYNGGEGQPVSGTVSWNRTINASQEFDPPGAGTRTIYFRVRARDIYGLDGAWSLPQRIDVDKNVPKIGSGIALTLKQGATELSYVADSWLKGSWSLVGSIEDESGIDSITISGDINGSLAANPAWFTNLGGDNYRFEIPLTTAASAGRVSFTISALDKSTPQLQTSLSLSVQADNQAPTLNAYTGALPIVQSNLAYTLASSLNESGSGFGKVAFYFVRRDRLGNTANDRVYMPMAGNSFTALSGLSLQNGLYYLSGSGASRPDEYTLQDAALSGNENVRVGGLVRIAGLDRRIVTWTSGSGTLSWADAVDTGVTDYQIAYAQIVDNQTVETPVYTGGVLTNIINDDGDGMVESVERSGGLYSWTASIDSRNIPDGPIELHWVSFDKAGNYVASSLTSSIANNRPLLAAVTLGTDLDGDGSVSAGERVPAYSALDAEGNEQSIATIASSAFTAKGRTTVDIEVVGGNGQLFYALTVGGTDIHGGLQNLRSDGISPIDTVSVSEAQLLTIGEGARSLVFTLWDSTEESLPGSTSLSAELSAPITVRLIDTVTPKVVINPFFWNTSSDNSLYGNSKLNGHIELTGVIDGTDPDISGQVSVRGTAYDDQRLTSLWMAIDGFVFTGAGANGTQFDTDGDGSPETLARSYYRLASFNAGAWTGTDRWATDGWKFAVTPVSLGQDGHLVNWQLDWDSARVTNVAALNRVIRVLAQDKRANPQANASSETANPSGDVSVKNVPSYQVDVVPYISAIKTRLSTAYSSNWSVINRSALGFYPVAVNEIIELFGFNFNGTSSNVNINGTDVGNPTAPNVISQYAQFRISTGAIATSGNLTVTVNGISSLNNQNDNGAAYNGESNTVNNLLLTDDRKLYIWNFSSLVTNSAIRFPSMRVSTGASQQVGFIYDSGAQFVRMNLNGSDFQVDRSFTQWYDTAFAIDANGRAYGGSMNGDSGGDAAQDMNGFNGVGGWANFKYYAWNTAASPGTNSNTNTSAYSSGTKARAIENAATNNTGANFNPNRVQQPKMTTYIDGATARVFMSYYDDISGQLRYRAGTVAGAADTPTFGGALINHDNVAGGSAPGFHTVASSANAFKPGQYSAIGITNDGLVAVMAWYDADARRLVYSWNNSPNTASAAQWQTNASYIDEEFTGWYVDLAVDSDNGIHIAYYNSSSGDLKYAYMSGYNAAPEIVTVDSYLSTGTNVSIAVRQIGANQVPYISYYMGAYTSTSFSLRTAWRTNMANLLNGAELDRFTGHWEVMTVPSGNIPKDYRIGIGIKNNGSADSPILGYATATNLETAHLK
jgi:large repetitive protein